MRFEEHGCRGSRAGAVAKIFEPVHISFHVFAGQVVYAATFGIQNGIVGCVLFSVNIDFGNGIVRRVGRGGCY